MRIDHVHFCDMEPIATCNQNWYKPQRKTKLPDMAAHSTQNCVDLLRDEMAVLVQEGCIKDLSLDRRLAIRNRLTELRRAVRRLAAQGLLS